MRLTHYHGGVIAIIVLFICTFLLVFRPIQAQSSLVVNKLDDTNDGSCDAGDCSLREAIAAAPAGATITFAPGLTGTIILGSQLEIVQDVTISGPGVNVITLSGN